MRTRKIILLAAAFLMTAACEDPNVPLPIVPAITVSPGYESIITDGIHASAEAQTYQVKFTATDTWSTDITFTGPSDWLTILPGRGSAGEVDMTIDLLKNSAPEDRSCTIAIKCGEISVNVSVTQEGTKPEVIAVTGIRLDRPDITLTVGGTVTLVATVSPDNATDKTVTWSSSAPTTAGVDQNGTVTALAKGEAVITAAAGTFTATCTVTVIDTPLEVESVSIYYGEVVVNDKSFIVDLGMQIPLTAQVSPYIPDVQIVWESSDTKVAIWEEGVVKTLAAGTATITASTEGKSASCTFVVKQPVESVTIFCNGSPANDQEFELRVGKTLAFSASIEPYDPDCEIKWSSSAPEVASFDRGTVTALTPGETVITATAGGVSASCKVTVLEAVEKINLFSGTQMAVNYTFTLEVGQEMPLVAETVPYDETAAFTWNNTAPDVVSFANGTVRALKAGSATLTASFGGKSASCYINVVDKQDDIVIKMGVREADLFVGENFLLEIEAGPASYVSPFFHPYDETVIQLSGSFEAGFTVKALKEGTVELVCEGWNLQTQKYSGVRDTCRIRIVNRVENASVTLDRTELTLVPGQSATLSATTDPAEAAASIVWRSVNPAVATVRDGKVTAVAPGTTLVYATAGGATALCTVTVSDYVAVTSVTLDKTIASLVKGKTLQLHATVNPGNATEKALVWSSSDNAVATVDQNGLVTGVAAGRAVIKVKAGAVEATCTITVILSGIEGIDDPGTIKW